QPEQQTLLYKEIKVDKYFQLFKFCCCTGLRPCEALGLKVENVDFKNQIIKVRTQITRKGELTPILKSDAAYREIPFLPELFEGIDLSNELVFPIKYSAADSFWGRLFDKLGLQDIVFYS